MNDSLQYFMCGQSNLQLHALDLHYYIWSYQEYYMQWPIACGVHGQFCQCAVTMQLFVCVTNYTHAVCSVCVYTHFTHFTFITSLPFFVHDQHPPMLIVNII